MAAFYNNNIKLLTVAPDKYEFKMVNKATINGLDELIYQIKINDCYH
jgi:hypothetical protein